MKKIASIILILMFMVTLCACQPTPEKSIVANKGDNELTEKIQDKNSEVKELVVPKHWSDSFADDAKKAAVEIDADISVPPTDTYPVARVEKIDVTEEWLEALISKLNNNGKVYEFKDETFVTKADIQDIILRLKRDIADLEQDQAGDHSNTIAEKEAEIEAWEKYYSSAPDVFEKKKSVSALKKAIRAPYILNVELTPEE